MDPKIKQEWTEALRSGKYQQGRQALRVGDTFCCLGVLCELHAEQTGHEWGGDGMSDPTYLGDYEMLPEQVRAWAGLDTINPRIRGWKLSALNDEEELSFPEIADLIEVHL